MIRSNAKSVYYIHYLFKDSRALWGRRRRKNPSIIIIQTLSTSLTRSGVIVTYSRYIQ